MSNEERSLLIKNKKVGADFKGVTTETREITIRDSYVSNSNITKHPMIKSLKFIESKLHNSSGSAESIVFCNCKIGGGCNEFTASKFELDHCEGEAVEYIANGNFEVAVDYSDIKSLEINGKDHYGEISLSGKIKAEIKKTRIKVLDIVNLSDGSHVYLEDCDFHGTALKKDWKAHRIETNECRGFIHDTSLDKSIIENSELHIDKTELRETIFRNCSLETGELNTFTKCSFVSCTIDGSPQVGFNANHFKNCKFKNCSFNEYDMRRPFKPIFDECEFVKCEVEHDDLKKIIMGDRYEKDIYKVTMITDKK